ncbi:putative WD repeat-containing protein, partial [Pseudolycoriella hygida]
MGNYCSSTSKDKDNNSEKSDDSPSYQLVKKKSDDSKEAPLADPEPTSDISNQNIPSTYNGNINRPDAISEHSRLPSHKILQSVQSDSASNSPVTLHPPCELPTVQILPQNLLPLNGYPTKNRRTANDQKIVLYILAADNGHKTEKSVVLSLFNDLKTNCASRGFEIYLSDVHQRNDENFLDASCWIDGPLEAKGGHHLAASSLAEITRHSNLSYIIPIIFLGTSLGSPLLPLTIENHDFVSALSAAGSVNDKELLEKWYILDDKAQPQCYRLKTIDILPSHDSSKELELLLTIMLKTFPKEMRDSYLTTVVEQEINNTVLISQELLKRCIWIQTGSLPPKSIESSSLLEIEMNRRINNIHNDLRNQIPERNLIRIPPTIQLQQDQLAAVMGTLISGSIDSIIDEHINKFKIPYCTYGVDRRLLEEIEAVNQHSKVLGQNSANFSIMDKIKSYITQSSSEPLVIFGKPGSGKSVLSAKVAQDVHTWLPDCNFIIRYTGLTSLSSDIVSVVGSIAEQLCYLTKTTACQGPHDIDFYSTKIQDCIQSCKQPLIILIDSLESAENLSDLNWLPTQLPENVKIIITISSEATTLDKCENDDALLKILREKLNVTQFVHLNQFSVDQWKDVLSFGGGDFYAANEALHLPEVWQSSIEKIPLQAKIFWWLAWLGEFDLKDISLANICDKVFEILENRLDADVTKFVMTLIVASRDGIFESEIIYLLNESKLIEKHPLSEWIQFCWIMGPMLLHTKSITLTDKTLRKIVAKRYEKHLKQAHKLLRDYYVNLGNEVTSKNGKFKCYNKKKFIELPYHAFKSDENTFATSLYLTDINWIYSKLNATGCVHILNDIYLIGKSRLKSNKHLQLLEKFLTTNIRPLNYDGRQFYSLFPAFLKKALKANADLPNDKIVSQWLDQLKVIPIPYLEELVSTEVETEQKVVGYDAIMNLGGKGYFVASLSTEREEICVWDVPKCTKVRVLKGIPQPTALCPVGDYGAAVLCRREIKVIDLNEGAFKVTLKGVMNQKMPYFGLHDSQHLVCLSRNRMYVNLMNLESGDCITTFKAGEDRFLNSLLVSGDGRILVCGDETQKPFPLLVWHLSQRKLLYDLRIPHHDFITSLSAITHEGSYVSVVAKELNEPTPNFIVVYDLQSGTLFKKWKPSCNTVSIAISQTNTCVIAGLDDARILIWDLVTGNCKYTLVGHSAPVTLLKLDPQGKVLLSTDKEGRDSSVRMWELDTGKLLAVHTSPVVVTTCEILPDGKFIILALQNQPNLVTLRLKNGQRNSQLKEQENDEDVCYGNADNDKKTFQ